jgi:2,4-dienoyl-CoA reductase-like NADH-dependent reductase (Old Yellow Enzyme family)
MSDQITEKMLQGLCDHINRITKSPMMPYTHADGKVTANIGCYYIDAAYSGFQLVRMSNEGGGVSQPLGGGFCTKRELYNQMRAFISGIEQGKG